MAGKFLQDLLKEGLETAISKGTVGNVYEDAINNAFKNIKRNTTAIMNDTPYNIIMNPRTYKGSIETTVDDFKISELSFSLQSKDALSDVNIGATYNNWAENRGIKESINDQYKNMYDYMMNMDRIELTGQSLSDDELEHVMEVGREARRNKTYQSNNYSGQGADRAINYINGDRRTSVPVNTSPTGKSMDEKMIEFAKQRQERWDKVKEKADATYKKNRDTLVTGKNRNHQLITRENARRTQIDDFQKELDIVNSEISELKKQRLKTDNIDDRANMTQQIKELKQRQKGLNDNIRKSKLGGSDASLSPTLELMPPKEGAPMFEGGAVPSTIANDTVFNQQQAEQTRKAFEQKLDETKEAIINNANVEKPSTRKLKNATKSYRPEVKMEGNNIEIDSIYNHSIPKRINKNNASQPEATVPETTVQPETTAPERSTRRPLTAEEQAAVDKANAQWRADNEARYAEMEKQIENMYNVDNIVFGSPEEILDPNYVSGFDPMEEPIPDIPDNTNTETRRNRTRPQTQNVDIEQRYKDIFNDWETKSGSYNDFINNRTVGPHNIFAPEAADDINVPKSVNRTLLESEEFINSNPNVKGLSKLDIAMTGVNLLGAIGDYKAARRKGHGVVSSAVRAGTQLAIDEALGVWALPVALIKNAPGAMIKGADMLYKENRRMNSAANQQVFGDAQFMDTQQLATMRQSGMEMAKMSQYNLQQTLMGNEATYLHR